MFSSMFMTKQATPAASSSTASTASSASVFSAASYPSASTSTSSTSTSTSAAKPIAIPQPYADITPPSSPPETEKSDKAKASAPTFKHYVPRSAFAVNVNMLPSSPVEDSFPPESPTLHAADPRTPPRSPATSYLSDDDESQASAVEATVKTTISLFHHATPPRASFFPVNGTRRPSSANSESKAPEPKAEPTTLAPPVQLPPTPVPAPLHSSSAEIALTVKSEDSDKPPTKDSHRCRLCGTWVQTRRGPGRGKPTHGMRMHMLKWHTNKLGIEKCREEIGARGCEGWVC